MPDEYENQNSELENQKDSSNQASTLTSAAAGVGSYNMYGCILIMILFLITAFSAIANVFIMTAGLSYSGTSAKKLLYQYYNWKPDGPTGGTPTLNFPFDPDYFGGLGPDLPTFLDETGDCLDEYMKNQFPDPEHEWLYKHGKDIMETSQEYNIHPAFLVAIAQQESGLATALNYTHQGYNYANLTCGATPANLRQQYNINCTGDGWEIYPDFKTAIRMHARWLGDAVNGRQQKTIIEIANGPGGTYQAKNPNQQYSPTDCEKSRVTSYAFCPCGRRDNGQGYGTADDPGDPAHVNQYWIPGVTQFFDRVIQHCPNLQPARVQSGRSYIVPLAGIQTADMDNIITSTFGYRSLNIGGVNLNNHTGLDFALESGHPIIATKDGIVTIARWGGGYGNLVVIDHEDGTSSYYGHLSSIAVSAGDRVSQGQTIGLEGTTGYSTGPHLHFEIRRNGEPVDPYPLLKESL